MSFEDDLDRRGLISVFVVESCMVASAIDEVMLESKVEEVCFVEDVCDYSTCGMLKHEDEIRADS